MDHYMALPIVTQDASSGQQHSESSAPPPGFTVKGKFLQHTICSGTSELQGSSDFAVSDLDRQLGITEWKKHYVIAADASQPIYVPIEWVMFIACTLLDPNRFDWVKNFLKSPMWNITLEGSNSEDIYKFHIPKFCPTSVAPSCSQETSSKESIQPFSTPLAGSTKHGTSQDILASSTSALHLKGKRKDRAPVVESEVRRSLRLQQLCNGFKKKKLAKTETTYPAMPSLSFITAKMLKIYTPLTARWMSRILLRSCWSRRRPS